MLNGEQLDTIVEAMQEQEKAEELKKLVSDV